MEGVEVLNTIYHTTGNIASGILFLSISLGALFLIFYGFYWFKTEVDYRSAGIVIAILFFIIFSTSIFAVKETLISPIETTYYQVIIDDSISMADFNEKYDIIKVEGKIYTVEEREN